MAEAKSSTGSRKLSLNCSAMSEITNILPASSPEDGQSLAFVRVSEGCRSSALLYEK
jgi:hypothetical protein